MLFQSLPLLKGWIYKTKDIEVPGFTVEAGKTKIIDDIVKPGWFLGGHIGTTNKYTSLIVELFDPYEGYQRMRLQPAGLYAGGSVLPNPAGIWVSVYDDVHDIYTVVASPTFPLPFGYRWRMSVTAPEDSDAVVDSLSYALVEVTDEKVFRESLLKLLTGKEGEV